jgi:arylsulfatase A-like enzyme
MLFWRLFKIVFVIFFLYLLGDAFYRWDGFRYYGTFKEFIPAIALISVLWALLTIVVSILLWIVLFFLLKGFNLVRVSIRAEHIILFGFIFIVLGALIWKLKKIFFLNVSTSLEIKLLVLVGVLIFSFFSAILFRNKTMAFIDSLDRRINLLVWMFAIFVFLSLPVVAFKMRWNYKSPSLSVELKKASIPDKLNIILITFDALSAREMSLYAYHRKTTPFIDKWAENAYVFTRVEAASNFTTSATASLMTGKRVWTHRVFQLEGSRPINSKTENLPALLKKNDYFTMAFIVNPHTSVKVLGMSESFDIAPLAMEFTMPQSLFGWKFGKVESILYKLFGDRIRLHNWILQRDFILHRLLNILSRNFYVTEAPPEKAFQKFLDVIDKKPPGPFFAWIHLFPPHDPYLPPETYRGYFSKLEELRDYKGQESIRMEAFKYIFQYKPFPEEMQPVINLLRTYYDEFVRYCDKTFQDFIKELKRRGITNNTVIILSSDHGESFEHGYFTHGGPFLYEDVTNIPLIIKEPGQERGRVIDDLVEQIDIPATILDFAGIATPSWMEGRSLLPLIEGEDIPPKVAFSMVFEKNPVNATITKGTVAIWDGDYKLVYYLEKKESLLFNLRADPEELRDIKTHRLDVAGRLKGIITRLLKKPLYTPG